MRSRGRNWSHGWISTRCAASVHGGREPTAVSSSASTTLRGGDQWDNLIASTIDEVDYVIVVNSRALEAKSHAASYVNKEINRALEAQTARLGTSFIVPVLIDETPILRLLAKFHTIDLREPDGLRDLVRAVKREANRQVVAR